MAQKVVLAYSGGLDTSYCVKYLTEEKGLDVYGITVNTGGSFSDGESAYLYVVDDSGVYNVTGEPVIIGQAAAGGPSITAPPDSLIASGGNP